MQNLKRLKTPVSVYSTDLLSMDYSEIMLQDSFKVTICTTENFGNYTYLFTILMPSGEPLEENGWRPLDISYHQSWNENHRPCLILRDPEGNVKKEFMIPEQFAVKHKNTMADVEIRLSELYTFLMFISKFRNWEDYDKIHRVISTSEPKDAMAYYLDFIKIKDNIPEQAVKFAERRIREAFEGFTK